MTIYVATTNPGKLRDFAAAADPRITLLPLPGLKELDAPAEDEPTFEGNARIKAIYYSQRMPGEVVMADDSGLEVDALEGAPGGLGFAYCWAWIDETAGTVRARCFVPAEGIAEDEATGSAALTLSGRLGRSLEVRQGVGSLIHTRFHDASRVEAGGRVERV